MKDTQLILIKQAFRGVFRFTRFVSNPKTIVTGLSVFSARTNRAVLYKEDGIYTLNGKKHTCYQQQTFLFTESNLIIKNSVGKTLHIFNLKGDNAPLQDTHICKHDRYEVDIDIQSDDKFTISYCVQGPKKNYNMKTLYTRQKNDTLSTI